MRCKALEAVVWGSGEACCVVGWMRCKALEAVVWGSGEACCVVGWMRCKALEAVVWGSGEAFLCDLCRSRTSIFEVFAILGYVFHFCFHYMLHLQLFYFFRTPIFHFV